MPGIHLRMTGSRWRNALLVSVLMDSSAQAAEGPKPAPTPARVPAVREKAEPSPEPLALPANGETPSLVREWKEGAEFVRVYLSSPRPSGIKAEFGRAAEYGTWWAIESPPPPAGFVLKGVTFHLVGHRYCAGTDASPHGAGTFAECRQERRDEKSGRWAFRMQGQEEWEQVEAWRLGFSVAQGQIVTSGPAATSRGVLICTYAPAATPAPGPASSASVPTRK